MAKIAGVQVGDTLSRREANRIARVADLTLAQVQNRAERKADAGKLTIGGGAANLFSRASTSATTPSNASPSVSTGAGAGGFYIDPLSVDLAKQKADLENKYAISEYGWDTQKAMENIRQAAETERLKYEVDNRIPVVEAESRGKIDLQKIVNSGYKNIANIERGSDMFKSIMGAFNF